MSTNIKKKIHVDLSLAFHYQQVICENMAEDHFAAIGQGL